MDNKCAICPRPGDLCPGCKDIRYCCRSHQKDDWPTHKLVCRKFALRHKLPHPGKVWVLYFPVDRKEPEFRLLPLGSELPQWKNVTWSHKRQLRVNGCSSTCPCEYDTYDIQFRDSSNHTPLCQHIYIGAPEQSNGYPWLPDSESLEVNECVQALTGDTSWKGPVIAFRKSADEHHHDADMKTSFFNAILNGLHGVVGVRINCDGLVKAHNAPRFEAITIKSYNLREEIGFWCWNPLDPERASPFTQHTGIVLQAKPESPYRWNNPNNLHHDQRNSVSRLMSIPCEIKKHNFGYYSRSHRTGNVIVMREDRKPLDVEYVRIICEWISNELRPLFKQARAECIRLKRDVPRGGARTRQQRATRARVFRRITKQSLLAYSRGRLSDEDAEDAEDEEMADVIENEDTTDDEMPEDGEKSDASDDDIDMFSDEISGFQDDDDAE